MSGKSKGSRTERELLHMFWDTKYYCLRVAGSGSMPLPCPDLLAGKNKRALAVECKSGKATRYISKEQVRELVQFAKGFGAEPWVAIRFDGMEWRFLQPKQLKGKTNKHYALTKDLAFTKGISFLKLIKN